MLLVGGLRLQQGLSDGAKWEDRSLRFECCDPDRGRRMNRAGLLVGEVSALEESEEQLVGLLHDPYSLPVLSICHF